MAELLPYLCCLDINLVASFASKNFCAPDIFDLLRLGNGGKAYKHLEHLFFTIYLNVMVSRWLVDDTHARSARVSVFTVQISE
jgi:hypothetical protein